MATGQSNSKVDMSLLWKEFPQFKDATVRVDKASKMASVLDVIELVVGSSTTARKAWFDMRKSPGEPVTGGNGFRTEVLQGVVDLKINGKGNVTPVAPFRTLLEIIYLLPGKRAHDFRKTSAQYMARLLSGDLLLIEEIEARFDNSSPEEREFFRNGTDETPDRKRRREELEEERRLRLRREEAEITRLERENQKMAMDNLAQYEALLERLGLDRDPRMRQLVNDSVSNMLLPNQGLRAIEGTTLSDYVTVGKFVVDRGIKCKSASALGRMVSKAWRDEMGCEPETTQMVVNGDVRTVKLYPVSFLAKHVV